VARLVWVEFAAHMRVDRATVSRWESDSAAQSIGPTADRLLRLAVAHGTPTDTYPISTLTAVDATADRSALLRMQVRRGHWEEAAAA
jgi:transcriptional regulator with XRE-family HTH domain